jgi:hypothetical protein
VRLDGLALGGGGGGSPSTATFLWERVCEIDFAQEDDQALDGGNLTVTNRVDGSSIVLAGAAVAITSAALVMTAAASSNLSLVNASTRTAALLGAAMTTWWPDFDGHPVRWGAEVTAAPTFDAANRAWGVFAENAAGLGGGNLGAGFSAEVRVTGAGAATRQSRWQGSGGSSNVASLSTTAYASGLVCGLGLDGRGPVGLWSTTADDLDELDTLSAVGLIGAPGGSSGGSPVQGVSRLGVFAVASSAGSFVTSIKRLVLWARVARVA